MSVAVEKSIETTAARRVLHRTGGSGHGEIVRLMSPSDLGLRLKPFVFLDLFDAPREFAGKMPIHPHSGIATVTLVIEGDLRFDDPESGTGTIGYGGVEWMQAGAGVWHGQEMSAGNSARVRGFQLWIALPAELETGSAVSQYLEADRIPEVGPVRVILGEHAGMHSPVKSPAGLTYLLVTLLPGERWTFIPATGETIAFVALSRGSVSIPDRIAEGELAVIEPGTDPVTFEATGDRPSVLVLGSSAPHPHDLHLGYYSVHTSATALAAGEARIADLGEVMRAAGDRRQSSGASPIFRA